MNDLDELRDQVDELENRFSELEKQVNDSVKLDKKVSLVEFVKNSSRASTDKEKLVTIGYYLEAYEDQETFTTTDIEDKFQQLGEDISNAAARASEALSEGWVRIVESGPPREYELTKTGGEFVESLLE